MSIQVGEALMEAKKKKPGRKPGVKVGPYNAKGKYLSDAALDKLFKELEKAIISRIRYINGLMKRLSNG